jgi:hypothetical protein
MGPFFINLISSLFIFIFISLNFKKINLELFSNKLVIACLIFVTYLILNSVLLNAEHSSKLHTFTFGRFFLFSFAILFFLQKIKDKLKWISFAYFAISLFVSLDIIYQFIFQKDLLGYLPGMCSYPNGFMDNCQRYAGVFGDEYIAGNFLATFGVFSFFIAFEQQQLFFVFFKFYFFPIDFEMGKNHLLSIDSNRVNLLLHFESVGYVANNVALNRINFD